jgi:hypothetical protein
LKKNKKNKKIVKKRERLTQSRPTQYKKTIKLSDEINYYIMKKRVLEMEGGIHIFLEKERAFIYICVGGDFVLY